MLGGAQRRAARTSHIEAGRPYQWIGGNVSEKPDWENAPYVFKGTSNKTSYNHKQPGAYVRKDERPGTTGLYKKDKSLGLMGDIAANLMAAFGPKALGKSAGTTRGK